MPYRYPPEFHRRVLDLVAAGRSVASIAADLGVSKQTVYTWRKQELSDTGVEQFLTTVEAAGLSTAKRRIAELESELAVTRRANELLKEQVVFPRKAVRGGPPSDRTIRHVGLSVV